MSCLAAISLIERTAWLRLPGDCRDKVLQLALDALRTWPVSDEKISFEYQLKRFLEGSLMPPDRAHVFWNGTFSEEQKSALLKSELPPALDRILADCATGFRQATIYRPIYGSIRAIFFPTIF